MARARHVLPYEWENKKFSFEKVLNLTLKKMYANTLHVPPYEWENKKFSFEKVLNLTLKKMYANTNLIHMKFFITY